jgi:ABC-type transporter Mla subunit MlaD
MELTATALRGASTTAQSFSQTADQTTQAASAASVTLLEVRSDLSALEAQLRSVSLLGATPLASSADAVARITASLDGLNAQIPTVTDSLTGNRDALARNAAALGALADSTAAFATRLGPTAGQDPFGDAQLVIVITVLLFTAWSAVPAVGALALAAWLRGELARSASS